ncbi:hypothetical protein GUJ93_ZPchr0004g38146 [Zizania palustris]|uniref:Uncharacterized protein n=1 Tax=Zizania palustris TaxID=103762 RepID=A0A8J5VM60_ZIZPA|nr:hypothetical protein GUJ93_ZPchr0004g38146 [Zizania palustris]
MLIYSGYRCSKESHARRLSYGGELTTILWLMAEHVGLFIAGKPKRGSEKKSNKSTGKDEEASAEEPSLSQILRDQFPLRAVGLPGGRGSERLVSGGSGRRGLALSNEAVANALRRELQLAVDT